MLKRQNPTISPNRFTSNGLKSLLEAASGKRKDDETEEPNEPQSPGSASGGGFSGSGMPEKGYGGKKGGDLEPLSLEGAKYTVGLPMAALRAGLGLQQADFFLSKMPLGLGQYAGMGALSFAAPQLLRFAGEEGAASEAEKNISDYETKDLDPDELDVFDTKSFSGKSDEEPKTLQTKTIKYGDKEISVKPGSLQYKLSDPYGVRPFVDFANKMKQAQDRKKQSEKDMLDLGKQRMPTGKF